MPKIQGVKGDPSSFTPCPKIYHHLNLVFCRPLVETSEVNNLNAKHASIGYVAHVISFVGRRSASGMPGNGSGDEVVRGWPGVCKPNKRGWVETPGLIETNWVELKHQHSRTGFRKGDPTYEYLFHHRKVHWRQTDKKDGYHMTPQQLQMNYGRKGKIDKPSVLLLYIFPHFFSLLPVARCPGILTEAGKCISWPMWMDSGWVDGWIRRQSKQEDLTVGLLGLVSQDYPNVQLQLFWFGGNCEILPAFVKQRSGSEDVGALLKWRFFKS